MDFRFDERVIWFGAPFKARSGILLDRLSGTNTFRASSSSGYELWPRPGSRRVLRCIALQIVARNLEYWAYVICGAWTCGSIWRAGNVNGVGFGARCPTCGVTAYPGLPLTSSWTDQAISATLPSTFKGITRIDVRTAVGADSVTFMASSAPPPVDIHLPVGLQFTYTVGGPPPPSQTIAVGNAGGGTLSWTASSNVNWIRLSSTPNAVSVMVDPTGLGAGTYRGQISFSAPGAAPLTAQLTLMVVAPPVAAVIVTSIANAASGSAGAVAPGEIVTIRYGARPCLRSFLFGKCIYKHRRDHARWLPGAFWELAAPITYYCLGKSTQLFRMRSPDGLSFRSKLSIRARLRRVKISSSHPRPPQRLRLTHRNRNSRRGQSGRRLQWAYESRGEGLYLTIYFTGGGQTNPAGVTGSVTGAALKRVQQTVAVTVGGRDATVLFCRRRSRFD